MLENLTPPTPSIKCKTCKTLEAMEAKDQEILKAALNDTNTWPAYTLSRELFKRGVKLSQETIARHREAKH